MRSPYDKYNKMIKDYWEEKVHQPFSGMDAKAFIEATKIRKPLTDKERERIRNNYTEIIKISKTP